MFNIVFLYTVNISMLLGIPHSYNVPTDRMGCFSYGVYRPHRDEIHLPSMQ